MHLRSVGLAAVVAAALVQSCQPACVPAPPAPAPTTTTVPKKVTIVIDGQGNGHGNGLSQWGAYGSAVNRSPGWSWQQILDHYYGGTRNGSAGNASIGVRLLGLDNAPTTGVISTRRAAVWNGVSYGALIADYAGGGRYDIYGHATPACPDAPVAWTPLGSVAGPVTFTTSINQTTGAPGDVLGVCQANGSVIHYRGSITARIDSAGATRTVNDVLVENYLRGVLSREVSTSWGNAGAGKGMHSLRAMAVAARSFALSQNRYGYAKTCDTSACQVYGGAAYRANATAPTSHPTVPVCESGNVTFECVNTNRSVTETAGVVRVWPDGRLVSTQYSASHGPRSAGGAFPPVDDTASNVPQNKLYRWTRSVDAAAVAARYGLGTLTAARTERDPATIYDGVWGNRVRLTGTTRTVIVSAWDFRNAFKLPSPGFTIRGLA